MSIIVQPKKPGNKKDTMAYTRPAKMCSSKTGSMTRLAVLLRWALERVLAFSSVLAAGVVAAAAGFSSAGLSVLAGAAAA